MLFWWLDGGTSWKQRAVRHGTGAATSSTTSTSANPTTGQKEHRFIDSNGAVHPTQYLSTEFVFDLEGHLKTFNVAKEKQPDGVWDFWEKLRLNPDMSDAAPRGREALEYSGHHHN